VGVLPPPLPRSRDTEATWRCAPSTALAVLPRRALPAAAGSVDSLYMSGRLTPPSRGWSGAVPTSAVVEFPTRQRPWERPGRSFRGIQQVTDWTVRVCEQLEDLEQRGREVVSEATSNEDYFRAYAWRYGAQVYKGSRRPLDPEGHIASLEGVLHSTIQQRDDLQAVVDQLRAELDRAQ
ncbi:hypothetical protein Taro_027661, partial [Colocasia esculenta]|nr:hypothetical protein [Colocasia esculenta]